MLETNNIYHGDCVELFRKIPENTINLVVTSPPYGSLRDYQGFSFDYKNLALEMYGALAPGGVVCWIVGDQVINGSESLLPFEQALFFKNEVGFTVHDTMIYQKRNFSHPQKNRYHDVFEYVFIFSKGKPKTFNPIIDRKNLTGGAVGNLGVNTFTEKDGSKSVRPKKITAQYGKRHNVWLGNSRGQEDMCVSLPHPAMMPRWLARDLIISFSNPGDLVVDPCVGSGTVCEEAKKLNRKFLGIDCSEKYVKIATENVNKIYNMGDLTRV